MALTKVIGDGLGSTNDLTVDTTTLTVDATNNRVGVGTATPLKALHIEGSSEADLFLKRADLTNKAWLFNVQSSTGDLNIKSRNDDGSASTTSMIIAHDGYVTKPLQPAFLAHPASQQDNLTVDAYTSIAFGTERFDRNGDFSSNTFTAPVTGVYQLNLMYYLLSIDISSSYYQFNLDTSNKTYYAILDPNYSGDKAYQHMCISILADMDANDTASSRIYTAGGAAQTDVAVASMFSGYLVA